MNRRSLWFVGPKQVELRTCSILPLPKDDEISVGISIPIMLPKQNLETVISAISPGTELKVYNGEFHTQVSIQLA
jgi:hypothetical protein